MLYQFVTIFFVNVRSLPNRWGGALVTVIGIGCVVAVFVGLFSIAVGYARLMDSTGSENTFIVLREGSQSEMMSPLHADEVPHILNSRYIKSDEHGALASPEFLWNVQLVRSDNQQKVMVGFRGITPAAYRVRDNFEVIEGRQINPGLNEILVGRNAQIQYDGLQIGDHLNSMGKQWTVVGVFSDNGGASESELWVDLPMIQDVLPWGEEYQSVRVKLSSPSDLEVFNQELAANPQVLSQAIPESAYYRQFSGQLMKTIVRFSLPLTVLMTLGAISAALNTMYNSIAVRKKEIATLRSLGYRRLPIALSTIAESMLLALIGAILSVSIIYIVLDGYRAVTNSDNDLAVQVEFAVTWELALLGILCALIVGLIGGVFPAARAARIPMASALRES